MTEELNTTPIEILSRKRKDRKMSEKKNFEIGQQWRCRDGGRAVINAALCENDLYVLKGSVDPMAVCQNMLCEIEKVMGIYPNVSEQNK